MKKTVVILLILFCAFSTTVYGQQENLLEEQIDILEFDEFNKAANNLKNENAYIDNFNLKETALKIINGEFDMSPQEIISSVIKLFLKELLAQFVLIRKIIIICVLSALLRNLSFSFKSESISELGFYACYITLVILLLDTFKIAVNLVFSNVGELINIMQATLPLIAAFFAVSGQAAGMAVMHPLIVTGIHLLSLFIRNIILPLISFSAMLEIVNHISSENVLDQMSELFRKSIGWLLKGISILFMAVLSLQSLGAPVLNAVVNKTAKVAVGSIPYVGEVLTGAVDTVMGFAGVAKSGITAAVIIFIILFSAVPVIKLLTIILSYKLTAALIQPVCEERIVLCLNAIGSYAALLLGALVTVIVMFIVMMLIVLGASRFV